MASNSLFKDDEMMEKNTLMLDDKLLKNLFKAIVIGMITIVFGVFYSDRIWMNLLLSANYITGLAFAGMFFVAVQFVSNAGWGAIIRRIPESMFSLFKYGFLFMIMCVIGSHELYEWTHTEVVNNDPILLGKKPWLNLPGFIIRIPIYFGIWYVLGRPIIKHSHLQDVTGDVEHTQKSVRWSAAWLYLGSIALVISSFDWIMSIEPHWFSTIFGLYHFSGIFNTGLAFIIIILIYLRRNGSLTLLKDDHLHELGRYLFAFITFWVYIWFSQHMLIWYANIPEETSYYLKRHDGPFLLLSILNICLNWLIPFTILLFRKTKRMEKTLLFVSVVVLCGHWLDLYLMIFPPFLGEVPQFGLVELGVAIGIVGLSFGVVMHTLSKWNLVPRKDPYFNESLNLHT